MSASTINPSLDRFVKDVENHQMQVLVDDDLHRSLLFKQPGTGNLYFRINTWPNHLCISGDMGTFVFSRLPDMFEFFRDDKEPNLGYWSEKLESGTAKKYSAEEAEAKIFNQLNYEDINAKEMKAANRYIKQLDLSDELCFFQEIMNWDADEAGFQIDSSDLGDCKEYTYHFVWCCRAIIWAIQQYDALKAKDAAL